MIRASIAGGSGYAGGELLRLLLAHPRVEVAQTSSRSKTGSYVHQVHPNLRGRTSLRFTAPDELERSDVLFLALPHGEAARGIERYAACAERVIDLSADFRLQDGAEYERWYGEPHPAPEWLGRFVYGLAETRREELRNAMFASGVGCNATAAILALLPLAKSGAVARAVVDLKVGSSEGGNAASEASHHPERSGCVRSYAPAGHRHQAEVAQELGSFPLHFSVTSIEMVRGVLCTAHVFLAEPMEERDLWRLFREHYAAEPFVRLVKERQGIWRYPEPKILAGTNQADVGFEIEQGTERVVVISAIDNLMKGAAGSAVQAMNLMCGFDETTGLDYVGLHPI